MKILGVEFGRHKATTLRKRQLAESEFYVLHYKARAEEHRAAAEENDSLARMHEQRIERLSQHPLPFHPTTP